MPSAAKRDYAEDIRALGLNPPSPELGQDMERTYHETVRNMVGQGLGDKIPAAHIEEAVAHFEGYGEPENEPVTLTVGEDA